MTYDELNAALETDAVKKQNYWELSEALELCTLINGFSKDYGCHPALTGGLLYKKGPRKDCDIVIYQRGDTGGERMPIDWLGFWSQCTSIKLILIEDFGYVKKCEYKGKVVDIFDPTQDGSAYAEEKLE